MTPLLSVCHQSSTRVWGGGAVLRLPKDHLNPYLMDPAPDTTYVVGDNHVFQTDGSAGTILAHVEDLSRGVSHHVPSGKGGRRRLRGGHLLDRAFGGGTEDINLVATLHEVNRGAGHSFGNVEKDLRALLDADPKPVIRIDIAPEHVGASDVPSLIPVQYQVNGGEWIYGEFANQ